MNLSRSCLIEYLTYCALQFLNLHVIRYTMFLDIRAIVMLVLWGWSYWGFGCFCYAVGKGFVFHFLTVVVFIISSFYWVSIALRGVFK